MDLVYAWLGALGYPRRGIDLLRRHRLLTIMVLAAMAWIPVIVFAWVLFSLAS